MSNIYTWTAIDLANLDRAIASGAKRVKYSNDQEVEYRDLSDMLKARELIHKYLNGDNGSENNNRVAYTTYTR